jgi:hypothetical protein
MVPAFRYHVLTLVGVFLALGVGMLIGSSTLQGAIVDSLTHQLRDLNAKFDTEVAPLREENKRTADAVAGLRQDLASVLRLHGRAAIVRTGDYPDAARDVQAALTAFGVDVTSTTTFGPTFPVQADLHLREVMEAVHRTHAPLPMERESLFRIVALVLARGSSSNDLEPLTSAGLIETSGDYSTGNDYVIIVGGVREESESRTDSVDLPLIRQLKTYPCRVLYVEPKAVFSSALSLVAPETAAAIPEVDTEVGRMALVLKLKRLEPAASTTQTSLRATAAPGQP